MTDPSLARLVLEHARRDPERVALRIEDDVLTYEELSAQAQVVAAGLATLGIRAGDPVATLMDTSADHVVVRLAISWLGGTEVALNTGVRGPALIHALALGGGAVAIVDDSYLPLVLEAAPDVPGLRTVVARNGTADARPGEGGPEVRRLAELTGPPLAGEPHDYGPGDPALVLFTSGSTGPSKGCLLPSRYVVRQAQHFCATLGITRDDVLYAPFPLFHADGAVFTVAAAFSAGATAALAPRFSVSRFWEDCRRHGVTVFDFMGATLAMLHKQPPRADDRDHRVRLAWGVPAPEWADDFAERFGVEVVEVYGLSDVGIVLYNRPGEPPPQGSCGTPIDAFEVDLHDENGVPVPVGEIGEIVVRAREQHTVLTRYVNNPEATAAAFRDGWFRTGDLARRDEEDHYFFVGRTKDIIRRRGENISAFELEQALLDHPDVVEVAAYGVPSELTEEDVMVTFVARAGSGLGADGLVDFAAGRVARHMVPRYVREVAQMPRTETEKVAKHVLKDLGVTADTVDREAGSGVGRATTRAGVRSTT